VPAAPRASASARFRNPARAPRSDHAGAGSTRRASSRSVSSAPRGPAADPSRAGRVRIRASAPAGRARVRARTPAGRDGDLRAGAVAAGEPAEPQRVSTIPFRFRWNAGSRVCQACVAILRLRARRLISRPGSESPFDRAGKPQFASVQHLAPGFRAARSSSALAPFHQGFGNAGARVRCRTCVRRSRDAG